jgi:hypothetical protein
MFSYKDQQHSSRGGDGKQASVAQGLKVTEDEVDAMIDQFATSDEAFEKTWSRRVVEYFFMNVSYSVSCSYCSQHILAKGKERINERGQSRGTSTGTGGATPWLASYFSFRPTLTLTNL